ncbi:acetamidase/formamidase family protein [Clostridium sp. LBM24168]
MLEVKQQEKYSYVFSRYLEPIANVKPGEKIILHTLDAFKNMITSEEDKPSKILGGYLNPQNGPIFIEGAEPGDTLVVNIVNIEPDRDYAVSCNVAEFGGLVTTPTTRFLNKPLEEKVWIYKKEGNRFKSNEKLNFLWKPFLGTIATAPELEALSALTPFNQGGNMDVKDVCIGNKIYLPITVKGAMLFTGDCHANQGDGELIGTALEIPGKITLKFDIIKGKKINWPRIENDEYIMTVGSAKPMEDAARIAYVELIEWMKEFGWDELEAYEALGQCGEMYVGNMVDTFYSLVAKIKKAYL